MATPKTLALYHKWLTLANKDYGTHTDPTTEERRQKAIRRAKERYEDSLRAERSAERSAERCQWFALCTNAATQTEPHPILGDVPICDRCRAKVKALE